MKLFLLLLCAISLSAETLIPPTLIHSEIPHYPIEMKQQGIEGVVELDLLVDEEGAVEQAVVTGSLHPMLDSLSRETAYRLKFKPATVDSETVAVELPYRFTFSLEEDLYKISDEVRVEGRLIVHGSRQGREGVEIRLKMHDSVMYNLPSEQVLKRLGGFKGQKLEDGELVTTTGRMGEFSFRGIPSGTFTLSGTSESIEPFVTEYKRLPNKVLKIEKSVIPLAFNNYEVVSTYHGADEVSVRVLSKEELGSVAGSAGDPVNALQSMPGAARTNGGELVLRGSRPEDTRYYLNDLDIPYLFHNGNIKSVIPNKILHSISFYPSGYGSFYGNSIGGVVNAVTDTTAPRTKVTGEVDINLLDMSGFMDASLTPSIRMTAGARISERFGSTLWYAEKMVGDDAIVPHYWDAFGQFNFTIRKKHKVDITLMGARDTLVTAETSSWDPREKRSFMRLSFSWQYEWERLKQKISYGHIIGEEREGISVKDTWAHDIFQHQRGHLFRSRWDFKAKDNFTISGGINGDLSTFHFGVSTYDPVLDSQKLGNLLLPNEYGTFSPWMELAISPVEDLDIRAGARVDYYGELNHSGTNWPAFHPDGGGEQRFSLDPSLRLSAKYRINDKHAIKGALGNYNQTPQPGWIMMDFGNGSAPDLKSSKAAHYTAGYEWTIIDGLDLDIQGYYNQRWDIPQKIEVNDEEDWIINTEAKSYGMELLLRRSRMDKFSGWLSYTLSKTIEEIDGVKSSAEFDQTHNLQLVGTFHLPKRWQIGGRFHYTTGNPYTPVDSIGTAYDTTTYPNDAIDIVEYQKRYDGPRHSERLDDALKLDLRISKTLLSRRTTTEIYFDVQNVLFPLYKTPDYQKYSRETGELVTFYTPPMPTLGVKVSF